MVIFDNISRVCVCFHHQRLEVVVEQKHRSETKNCPKNLEHEHPLCLCLTWLHITSWNSPASDLSLSFGKLEPHLGRAWQLESCATSEPVVYCDSLTQGSRRQEEQKEQSLPRITKEARSWGAHTQYVCGPKPSPFLGPQGRPNPNKTTFPVPAPCTHAPWDGFSLAAPLPCNTSQGCFSWWGALSSSG